MEANEDRLKKLEAGKEKLAAFRKRKAKKKKPDFKEIADGMNENEAGNKTGISENGESGMELHPPSMGDLWSDSDQLSCTSEDEWSTEEAPSKSAVFLEARLAQAKHRIAELEEAMEGKQLALDTAIQKTGAANAPKNMHAVASESGNRYIDEKSEVIEFETALAQRDALLSQLSATLFESLGNSELNSTLHAQMDALAQHVYQLQTQLEEADKTLEQQLMLHESSSKALQDAKFQMLQLQEIITCKDQQLAVLNKEKIQVAHQALQNAAPSGLLNTDVRLEGLPDDSASNLASLHEQILSKEQALASRESEWARRENEWMSREQEWALRDQERATREQLLQSSIESQVAQINSLSTSLNAMEAEKQELHSTCTRLEVQLKNLEAEAADRLSELEFELKELRKAHDSDQKDIQALRQARHELEVRLSSQGSSLSELEALQQEHDSLSAKYTECLALLRDSELVKCNLEEKLQSANISPANMEIETQLEQLKMKFENESVNNVEREKNFVELESKYSVDTDALSNKINELQNVLQKSESAMEEAAKAAEAEKSLVAELNKSLQEKNDELNKYNPKLQELVDSCSNLHAEKTDLQLALQSKEQTLTNLTGQFEAAQKALEQKENENSSFAEQIAAFQDELIAAKYVHEVEQSEWKQQSNRLEEAMEAMLSDSTALQEKLSETEHRLVSEQESKRELLLNIKKLEEELEGGREEERHILHTVQSINRKLEPFQELCEKSVIPSQDNTEGEFKPPEKLITECDLVMSKIDSLTKDLEQYKVKFKDSESMVNNLTEKLRLSEDAVLAAMAEANELQQLHSSSAKEAEIRLEKLEIRAREADQLQTEVVALKGLEQQLLERDKCQEELQSQLEETVAQWQKLQRIVQEKEISLHNSQEALEEQQRICSTLKKTFEEEREDLESEISRLKDMLQEEKDSRNVSDCEIWDLRGKVQILEGDLQNHIEANCSKEAVLSETVSKLQRELKQVKDRLKKREDEILNVQADIEEKVESLTVDITEKNAEIESLKNKVQEREEEIISLKSNLNHSQEENNVHKAKMSDLETSLSTLESQLNHLQCSVTEKDMEIQVLSSGKESQYDKMGTLEAELGDLKKACAEMFASTDQNLSGAERLRAVFSKKNEDIVELQNLVSQLQTDLATETSNSKAAMDTAQIRYEEIERALESAGMEKENVEEQLQMVKQKADEAENSLRLLKIGHGELQQRLEEKDIDFLSSAQEKESIAEDLAQMKQHVNDVDSKLELVEKAHTELQDKLTGTETALQIVVTSKNDIETELIQVKTQLSDAETKNKDLYINCSELQNRLDETEENKLSAIQDKESILAELNCVKRQNMELESNRGAYQATHAEFVKEIKIKEETLQTTAVEKNNLEEELLQVKKDLSQTEKKLMHTENKLQNVTKDKENVEKELNEINQEFTIVQDKCQLLQDSLSDLQLEEQKKSQEIEKLCQSLSEKDSLLCKLKKAKESVEEQLQELSMVHQRSQSAEALLQNAQDEIKLTSEAKDLKIGELETNLANSCEKVDRIEGFLSNLTSELCQKEGVLMEQASQLAKMSDDIQEKSNKMQELTERNEILHQQNELYKSQANVCMKENTKQQEDLKAKLEEREQSLTVKEDQISKLENLLSEEKSALEEKLRKLELFARRVQGDLSHNIDRLQECEAHVVDQAKLLYDKKSELANVNDELKKREVDLAEAQERLDSLKEELATNRGQLETLQSEKKQLHADVLRLRADLENQETTNTQYAVDCKQLNEKLTQMTQVLEGKDATVFNLNHDIEMYQKEISDLRTEVVQRDTNLVTAQEELESLRLTIERKNEEAEMLKANFDSCMEDMQIKLTEEEAKTRRLQSQIAEEARNILKGKDDLKEMFELQVSQMEDKIIKSEKLNEQLEKDLKDERNTAASSKDLYEHQLAELELNLQASNSDLMKYKDELSKVASNHECSVAGLKRLHEIQTGELEDNCMALEKTVMEQRRQISEMQSKFHKEKISLEQNFEIQLSDTEEKRRFTEHEVDRLKKHLDEMKSDHIKDMQQLEKKYESRLFELEDKYCIAVSERDRIRASLADQSGMNDSNIQSLEAKLQEVEVIRRELELNNHTLEDEILSLKESARQREEEMLNVLMNAADRHTEDTDNLKFELNRLNDQLLFHSKQTEQLKNEYEDKIQDLLMNKNQLKEKVSALELHMEHDTEFSKNEQTPSLTTEMAELQNVVSSLTIENNDLKHQLSMQRQQKQPELLVRGVEEICPPFQSTSCPSQEGSFSPTEETPVVEGFVAELSKQYETLPHVLDQSICGEPDFVEEQIEGFQPEIEDEQVMGDNNIRPHNIHPIQEALINEGFQPETSDTFVMEAPDGDIQPSRWPPNLSVGMSPSHLHSKMSQFDYDQKTSLHKDSFTNEINLEHQEDRSKTGQVSLPVSNTADKFTSETKEFTSAEVERKIQAVRDELEEKYVGKLRTQQVELAHDFATKQETAQREMEQSYAQRVQAVKYEWEHKFTKALQKVRKEMEKKHLKDLRLLRQGASPSPLTGSSPRDARAEVKTDGQEDLGETVEQLHKENQELAEVRDVLLQQIEMSQARGLHTKVQHELQCLLSNRDATTSSLSSSSSLSASATPTCAAASPTLEESSKDEKETDVDADVQSEASETSSARERFLEELEDVAQQSGQDLPLEWELTTTLMASAMIGAGYGEPEESSRAGGNPPEHRSIWEVFDGRCVRQDCQEVRLKLHRVTQWLLECRDGGEEAVSVSDLTLFLDEGFLFGDKEGSFCLANSLVEFVEDGSFELASDKNSSPRSVGKETPSKNDNAFEPSGPKKQMVGDSGFKDSDIVNLDKGKNTEISPSVSNIKEEEKVDVAKKSFSAELETLQKAKLDTEKMNTKLQKQLTTQNLDYINLQGELERLKEQFSCPDLSPVKSSCQNKDLVIGVSMDSGVELMKLESQEQTPCENVSTQTETHVESEPNDRIVHHLQLLLVEKESALAVLEKEITKLKGEMKSQKKSQDGHISSEKFKMFEEQIKVMNASLAAKDRLINGLQSDINRLIYPEKQTSPLKHYSDISSEPLEAEDGFKIVDDVEEKNVELNSMTSSLCENESGEVFATANESSALQGYHTALNVDIDEELGPAVSAPSSSNNSIAQSNYLFDDVGSENSGQGTPLGLQDKELANELKKLHRDMQETKALYSRENVLLQEALHKDRRAKHNVLSKTDPTLAFRRTASDSSSYCPISDVNIFQTNLPRPSSNTEADTLRQRLEICLEQNRMLERENNTLRAKIREQEATVVQLKVKLEQKEHDNQHWRDSFSGQIRALQSQRNDLMQLIRDLDSSKTTSPPSEGLSDESLVEDKNEKTSTAAKIQQDLMERLEELDHLHRMLTQRQVELQNCESERRHLEQLCLLKDLTEMQLMRQKHLMEEQLSELELRLRDRETTLVEEKTKLLAELKTKDASLPDLEGSSGFTEQGECLSGSQLLRLASSCGALSSPVNLTTSTPKTCHTPPPTPEEVDRQHLEAIERLKSKLKLEYEIRTARIDESHAAAINSFWERHQSKQN